MIDGLDGDPGHGRLLYTAGAAAAPRGERHGPLPPLPPRRSGSAGRALPELRRRPPGGRRRPPAGPPPLPEPRARRRRRPAGTVGAPPAGGHPLGPARPDRPLHRPWWRRRGRSWPGRGAFFRAMPVTGGLGSPLLYAVLIGWVGLAAAAFYQAIFRSVVGSSWGAFGRPAGGRGHARLGRGLGRLRGPGRVRRRVRRDRRVRRGRDHPPAAPAAGRRAAGLRGDLPGGELRPGHEHPVPRSLLRPARSAGIWSLVLYVLGLAEAHQIGHGKAAAAVLLPLVLVCCCCARGSRSSSRGRSRASRASMQ